MFSYTTHSQKYEPTEWVNFFQNSILYSKSYKQKYCKILKRQNLSNRNTGKDIAKFSRGGIFNQNYRQKYYKILERQDLSNINTGRDIAKFSRGVSSKPVLQAKIFKNPNRNGCSPTQHTLRNMNQLRMNHGSTGKISTSLGGTETIF